MFAILIKIAMYAQILTPNKEILRFRMRSTQGKVLLRQVEERWRRVLSFLRFVSTFLEHDLPKLIVAVCGDDMVREVGAVIKERYRKTANYWAKLSR